MFSVVSSRTNIQRVSPFLSRMKGYSVLILLLSCARCMAQTSVTLTAGMATVTEGTQATIDIICTLDAMTTVERNFGLDYEVTSTSEDGYDHASIGDYTCTVSAGQTVGTVSIPLTNDKVIDVPLNGAGGETVDIGIVDAELGGLTEAGVAVTIMDDGTDDQPITVSAREGTYKVTEADTVTIDLDFRDCDGNPAPIEETLMLTVTFPSSATTDTATDTVGATQDYTPTAGAVALTYTAGMAEITSQALTIATVTDTTPENLETFNVMIADMAAATDGSITADGAPIFQVQIIDDDKRELIIVHDMTPLPRRSRKAADVYAITDETGAFDIPFTNLVHNLKDFRRREQTVGTPPLNYLELILPRPKRNSKSRFDEYTFSKTQMFDTTDIVRTAHTFLTPTSHTEDLAPIESDIRSVLTVYPNADPCTMLDTAYTISVEGNQRTNKELRWAFIPEGGTKSDEIRLKNNGKTSYTITECGEAGLYIISRVKRGKLGWQEYIRVIQADCPAGMAGMVTACAAPTPVRTCRNGGVLDQALGLCTCPPGFAGAECELALAPGTFGSNCQFEISDYIKGNEKGKCLTFSYPDTFGVTCAAGYSGKDCCKPCKKGRFGANCAQTCHCVDDQCNSFSGACANGCLPGFSGPNCQ